MSRLLLLSGRRVTRLVGIGVVLMAMFVGQLCYAQDASRKTVGITPLVSTVADIPADAATDLFINALMETNRFAIKPPDAKGAFTGVEYVLETTINEGKAKTNVLGFLKDVATSKAPINLTIRVFDPQSNALVNSVTVKSTEVSNSKVSVGDVQSLMGAFGAAKGDQDGKAAQPDASAQLEERLEALMQQAATRLVSQLGGAASSGARAGAARTPLTR